MSEQWRCKTCKHSDQSMAKPERLECMHLKLNDYAGAKDMDDDELVYSYEEGGWFYVGPEFGCVHWEQQDGRHE